MKRELKRAWIATAIWFTLNSFGVASFVVRLPEAKKTLDLTNSELGIALFVSSLSAVSLIKVFGKICAKYGSRPIMVLGGLLTSLAVALVPLLTNYLVFVSTLMFLFIALTLMDIAMNTHAVTIEHEAGKLIMGRLHGIWSIGGVVGGLIGGICAGLEIQFTHQGFAMALLTLALVLGFRPLLLPANADIHEIEPGEAKVKSPAIFYLLGFVGICAAVIEGAAGDWGAVLITDEFGAEGFVSSLPYIIFQTAMVIGRFSSDSLSKRYGRSAVLLFCGSFVSLGLTIGLLVGGQLAVILAWFAMGVGSSVVIPMVFSLAGSIAKNQYSGVISPSQAVASVSGISYSAFLVGPPVIGFIADLISLRWAMLFPALLALGIIYGSRIAHKFE